MQSIDPNQPIKSALTASDKSIKFVSGSIILSNDKVKDLFIYTVNQIVEGVREVLRGTPNIRYIFMVGGFSESSFLQKAIKDAFETENRRVLIQQEAQLAIVKGPYFMDTIMTRLLVELHSSTYGTKAHAPFIPFMHEQSRLFVNEDGKRVCRNVFQPIVEMNSELEVGSVWEKEFVLTSTQTEVKFPLV